jgi:hypothetical protein
MATIEPNKALGRIRGKVDGWIYRELHGQLVVHAERTPQRVKSTAAQKGARTRFGAAQAYAAEVLSHPLRREAYLRIARSRKCPVNALLVSNFLRPPSIDIIELAGYAGKRGGMIEVLASDGVEVTDVTVRIQAANGATVESGAAEKQHGVWSYQSTADVPPGAGWQVEVTARNPAGTEATLVRSNR